jgi:hypothetical protein
MENYGLLNNIAGGLREGLIAMQTTQNLKRQQQYQDLMLQKQGFQQDESGNWSMNPEEQQAEAAQRKLTLAKAQGEQQEYEPAGELETGLLRANLNKVQKGLGDQQDFSGVTSHRASQIMGLIKPDIQGSYGLANALERLKFQQPYQDDRMDSRHETIHGRYVKDVVADPMVNQLITTSNNLENAVQNFKKGGATPQEFQELQQAVRSNAGVKGTSGVDERAETYLNSLGIRKDKFLQFLTGDPQSVMQSDPKFADQVIQLAELERQNKAKQAKAQMEKKASSHKSFYDKPENRDRAADLQSAIDQQMEQIGGGLLSAPGSESGAPKVGEVHDGYVFKGGDPSKKENWEKK